MGFDLSCDRARLLPAGTASVEPGMESVAALGRLKNTFLEEMLTELGADVYPDARAYLEAVNRAGLKVVVVSSSANTMKVLEITGLRKLVHSVVDAHLAKRERLAGKPAPDPFLYGTKAARTQPRNCAAFEDAISGIQSASSARCGYLVGVNRKDASHGEALKTAGANRVVTDLGDLREHWKSI